VSRKGFLRKPVKLAGPRVALDHGIKLPGVEGLEPGTEACKLARRKLFNGFFYIFGGGHVERIAPARS
jgi:hypothetical protein